MTSNDPILRLDSHPTCRKSRGDLQPLVAAMLDLSHRCAVTPVLVTPAPIMLQAIFFEQLAVALRPHAKRPIRFDWCRQVSSGFSLFSDWQALRLSKKVNKHLSSTTNESHVAASLQIAAMIGRPGGRKREFVIGWCDDQQSLPPWAKAIHLAGSRRQTVTSELRGSTYPAKSKAA
ncbi:hypothetical protein N9M41_01455 [Rhodopirellula sp.]|nr:hypothetical protein [Rhodopirellula sp.]